MFTTWVCNLKLDMTGSNLVIPSFFPYNLEAFRYLKKFFFARYNLEKAKISYTFMFLFAPLSNLTFGLKIRLIV